MKAIILLALVASVNVFAATNSNDQAPAANCAAAKDTRLTNDSPDKVNQQYAMLEARSTPAAKTPQKGSGASH